MKLKPILDKIVVKAQDPMKETAGGLIIAAAKNDGVIQGSVLAVGPGAYNDKDELVTVNVKVGNEILFNAASGFKFEHEKEEYIILTEDEIIAVLS